MFSQIVGEGDAIQIGVEAKWGRNFDVGTKENAPTTGWKPARWRMSVKCERGRACGTYEVVRS